MRIYDHCSFTSNSSRGRKILSVRLRQSFFLLGPRVIYAPNSSNPLFRVSRFIGDLSPSEISASCTPGDFPPWEIYRRTFAWIAVQGVPIVVFARALFPDVALGRFAIRFQLQRDERCIGTLRYISGNVIDWLSPIPRFANTVIRKSLNSTCAYIFI